MRNDFFPGWYIGQRWGDDPRWIRHIGFLGVDQGWGEDNLAAHFLVWPFGMTESYEPWP